jgi:hypothetical protein
LLKKALELNILSKSFCKKNKTEEFKKNAKLVKKLVIIKTIIISLLKENKQEIINKDKDSNIINNKKAEIKRINIGCFKKNLDNFDPFFIFLFIFILLK